MRFLLPRLLGVATAAYGAAIIGEARAAAEAVRHAGGTSPNLHTFVRTLGVRDLASGVAMAVAPSRKAMRVAIAVRVASDAGDLVVLGKAMAGKPEQKKIIAVAGGWGLLCALSALATRRCDHDHDHRRLHPRPAGARQPDAGAAAVRGADHVVPLFVRDDRITGTGFAAGRRQFLNESLDRPGRVAARARRPARGARRRPGGGDLPGRAGRCRATRVHIAGDVSAFAPARESALRTALPCELAVHDDVHTVVPPGAVLPPGSDHFAVFSAYHRRWADARVAAGRCPTPDPRHAAARSGPAPCFPRRQRFARRRDGGARARGRRGCGRRRRRLRGPARRAGRGPHVPAVAVPAPRLRVRAGAGAARPGSPGARRSSGSWRGATSTTRCWPPARPRRTRDYRSARRPLARRRGRARTRGGRARPASRSSTPACASCSRRAGCTTAPG